MGDIYALLTAVCWSFAVILFELSSNKLNPLQINIVKNSFGVIGFIITIFIFDIPYPNFSDKNLVILAFSGFIGVGIADLFFLQSLKQIGSSLSAIVATVYAPSVFIIAYIFFNEIITLNVYLGAFLVLGGIVVSTYDFPKQITSSQLFTGVLFGALAQVLTAASVLSVKPIMVDNPILWVALIRFGVGLISAIIFMTLKSGFKFIYVTFQYGYRNIFLLGGSFFGTYLSVILWLAGYKYTLAGRAAIYNQLSTVLISIMAVYFLKDTLTVKKKIGILLSFVGAIIVTLD
ncbi:MAG: DMT family transporter [Candidatus Neomarinimicrobiota bacterium]